LLRVFSLFLQVEDDETLDNKDADNLTGSHST
jgi:hypothetical protein